ncbi:MAG: hypothetical protein DYH17_09050 [Xanthomonadales bacterium PRO6]|nr:hypothetical protein [Xanthomonadales bacterium]MCE7931510.1 hypothetical protein [Xanthomonadales bacterium PRO6]
MRIAILILAILGASHAGATEPARSVHIVELVAPAALDFTGSGALKATRPPAGAHYRADAPAVRAYLDVLEPAQQRWLDAAGHVLGRKLAPRQRYRHLLNGYALELTANEARTLARQPDVARIERERFERLLTDSSPMWIGAPAAWAGVPNAAGTRGEGVVVGVIDTGIAHTHPAFAETDAEGYRHVNPRGHFYGLCAGALAARCNGKLIGIWDYTSDGAREGVDLNGHGSHVAGIAVGNLRHSTIPAMTTSLALTLSGVAPRANLIAYKACQTQDQGQGTCPGSLTTAALEQAIIDGVDVINYSIGGSAVDPWPALTGGATASMRALAAAVRAGIAVAISAGNSGPVAGSIRSPANSPWVAAVASTTSNRRIANVLTDLSGAQQPPPVSRYLGAGLAGAVGPVRLVLGSDFGSARCSTGEALDSPPTGASNPWTGQVFTGEIVICERGVQARVAKGFNVQRAGGGGMVLVNTAADAESVVSDDHFLPATHLGYRDGEQLKAWVLANPGSARGRLSGTQALREDAFGDVLAASSSRGPDPNATGVLRPSFAAPGVNILAPANSGIGEASLSGTSMASPHVAGALALLRARRPDETPGTLYSALALTANAGARLEDASSPADPLAAGAGRVRIDRALSAGLVMPITMSDFDRENPRAGGDPSRLNLPALYLDRCRGSCSFTRSFRAWRAGSYTLSDVSTGGARISFAPASFTLTEGQTQQIAFSVDVSAALGRRAHGEVRVRANDPSIPESRLVAQMYSDYGRVPAPVELATDTDRGSARVSLTELVALPGLAYRVLGPVPVRREQPSLVPDPTGSDPYDGGTGVIAYVLDLGAPGSLRADVLQSSARDIDLYVGRDIDGDGSADESEELCRSTASAAVESCILDRQPAGRYWVLVQNFAGTAGGDTVDLEYAALPSQTPNRLGFALGPASVGEGTSIDIDVHYDLAGLAIGARAVAALELRQGRDAASAFAWVPLRFLRTGAAPPAPHLLADGVEHAFLLAASGAHERLAIDVPQGSTRLLVQMHGASGDAGLYLAPATDANALGPPVVAPPLAAAVAVSDGPGSNETLALDAPTLTPGRWYVVARNNQTVATPVRVQATLTQAPLPAFDYETWYNPARDGHGLVFTRAGDAVQLVWYSYDADGEPIWHLAFPDALTAGRGQAHADLYRYHWVDGGADGQRVGEIVLARQSGRLVLDWELDGAVGSEPMQLLVRSQCVAAGHDPSGLWYEPARSGYGANFVARPDLDLAIFYLYDGAQRPRWVLGQNAAFDGSAMTLYQYHGFCPGCAAVPPTRRAVGSVLRSFDASVPGSLSGRWSFAVDWQAPLTGRFAATDTPTQLLTTRRACP